MVTPDKRHDGYPAGVGVGRCSMSGTDKYKRLNEQDALGSLGNEGKNAEICST